MDVKRCFNMRDALTLLDYEDALIWELQRVLMHAILQQQLDGASVPLMIDAYHLLYREADVTLSDFHDASIEDLNRLLLQKVSSRRTA